MGDAGSETASLPLFRASPADVHYQAQAVRHRGLLGEGGSCRGSRARVANFTDAAPRFSLPGY